MVDDSNIAEVQYLLRSYSFVLVKLKKILLILDYSNERLKVKPSRHFNFSLQPFRNEFN